MDRRKRILFTTFGSLGDVHPYIALALGLKRAGHHAMIGTSPFYRGKIESLGLEFHPIPPDRPEGPGAAELMRKVMDLRRGPETVICDLMMPALRESYRATEAAAQDADLLISHVLTYSTPLVAERLGKPWLSTALQPLGFFSAFDPPVLAPAAFLAALRPLGPGFHRYLLAFMKWTVRSWRRPVIALRRDLGLPTNVPDPLFEGQFSPHGNLCLFSKVFAPPQPDWPKPSEVIGFPFHDRHGEDGLSRELSRFLDDGPPPLVFTLGSAAVMTPGRFYEESAKAAERLGRRAVLLTGEDPAARPSSLPEGVRAFDYAPFSALFPRAAAIVHQGGIGTTAQALRSGRPMLVVPFAHDQPDNADRIVRLGVGRSLALRRYDAERAARTLAEILEDASVATRAAEVGRTIAAEDAIANGVRAIESALDRLTAR